MSKVLISCSSSSCNVKSISVKFRICRTAISFIYSFRSGTYSNIYDLLIYNNLLSYIPSGQVYIFYIPSGQAHILTYMISWPTFTLPSYIPFWLGTYSNLYDLLAGGCHQSFALCSLQPSIQVNWFYLIHAYIFYFLYFDLNQKSIRCRKVKEKKIMEKIIDL